MSKKGLLALAGAVVLGAFGVHEFTKKKGEDEYVDEDCFEENEEVTVEAEDEVTE